MKENALTRGEPEIDSFSMGQAVSRGRSSYSNELQIEIAEVSQVMKD